MMIARWISKSSSNSLYTGVQKQIGRKIIPTEMTLSPGWNYTQHYHPGCFQSFYFQDLVHHWVHLFLFSRVKGLLSPYCLCWVCSSPECLFTQVGPCKAAGRGSFFELCYQSQQAPEFTLYSLPSTLSEKFHVALSPLVHHVCEEVRNGQRVLRIQMRGGEVFHIRKEWPVEWTQCAKVLSSKIV